MDYSDIQSKNVQFRHIKITKIPTVQPYWSKKNDRVGGVYILARQACCLCLASNPHEVWDEIILFTEVEVNSGGYLPSREARLVQKWIIILVHNTKIP